MKSLAKSKTRLSVVLSPQERQTLTLTMLEDVLRAVMQSLSVRRIVVVSSDSRVEELAKNFGAVYLSERRRGLNQAIGQAMEWCIQNDAESVLVLPGDIPLITSSDVNQIVSMASDQKCIVIAPSRNGGTNALLQKPPNLIMPHFGLESFDKHLAEASNSCVVTKVFRSERVKIDIDSPQDLEDLLKVEAQTVSHQFLKQIGLDITLRKPSCA